MPIQRKKRSVVARKSSSRRPVAGMKSKSLSTVSRAGTRSTTARKGRKVSSRRGASGLIKRAVAAMR